jgi:hypothetical protein
MKNVIGSTDSSQNNKSILINMTSFNSCRCPGPPSPSSSSGSGSLGGLMQQQSLISHVMQSNAKHTSLSDIVFVVE